VRIVTRKKRIRKEKKKRKGQAFFKRLQPHQDVEVVVHHRETTHRHGEALRERLQAVFDPLLAVCKSLAAPKRRPHAAGDAVVVTSYIDIHDLASSRGHR
jgi:hypothetical protein